MIVCVDFLKKWKGNPMKPLSILLLCLATSLFSQAPAASQPDPFKSLAFLEGAWTAHGKGSTAAAVDATYSFRLELDKHILARHSRTSDCKAQAGFNCEHGDLLYVYEDAPGKPLKAIYFDNEGHVIHYGVTTPAATTAVFLSEASQTGPQFRLTYELTGTVMSGKFQMHLPGQAEWRSYLEWTGSRSSGSL